MSAQRADALPGLPSPCDLMPSGPLADACNLAGGVADPVAAVSGAGGLIGSAATSAGLPDPTAAIGGFVGNVFDQLNAILADTVTKAVDGLGAALSSAPEPPIGADWFHAQYLPLERAGIVVCLTVLFAHLLINLIRHRTLEMALCLRQFVLAVFFTATAPLFIQMGLKIADAFTQGFATWGGADAGQFNDKLSAVTSTISTAGAPAVIGPIVTLIVLVIAVGLILLWMVGLAIRAELLFIGTLAVPFVLPSIIDGKARFARIYFKTMFGVLISKPILIGTFCFGAVLLQNGGISKDGIWNLLGGLALLAAATFIPLVVIRVLWPDTAPVVNVVSRGASAAVSGARTVGMAAAGAVTGGASGAAMGAGAGAAMSQSHPRAQPPRRPPDPDVPPPRGGA